MLLTTLHMQLIVLNDIDFMKDMRFEILSKIIHCLLCSIQSAVKAVLYEL